MTADVRVALLRRLIDDAGVFPPARKPMAQAVADHRRDREGPHRWMLGRFLCPVSRLAEFAQAAEDARDWTLGAIFDGEDFRGDLERVAAYRGPGTVRVLEARLPPAPVSADDVRGLVQAVSAAGLSERVEVFLEVAPGSEADMAAALEAVARVRDERRTGALGAKLRCGGIRAELYPEPRQVVAFIGAARRLGVPFKATAGLHHPFRHREDSLGVLEYGFVNLLAAAALDVDDLQALVCDPRPDAFTIDATGLAWRGAAADAVAILRARELFTAYGCCAFAEPVADLTAHGIVPVRVHAETQRA